MSKGEDSNQANPGTIKRYPTSTLIWENGVPFTYALMCQNPLGVQVPKIRTPPGKLQPKGPKWAVERGPKGCAKRHIKKAPKAKCPNVPKRITPEPGLFVGKGRPSNARGCKKGPRLCSCPPGPTSGGGKKKQKGSPTPKGKGSPPPKTGVSTIGSSPSKECKEPRKKGSQQHHTAPPDQRLFFDEGACRPDHAQTLTRRFSATAESEKAEPPQAKQQCTKTPRPEKNPNTKSQSKKGPQPPRDTLTAEGAPSSSEDLKWSCDQGALTSSSPRGDITGEAFRFPGVSVYALPVPRGKRGPDDPVKANNPCYAIPDAPHLEKMLNSSVEINGPGAP
ncbi:basic salivary proline-rich protein 1-like [Penaeus monodon]|uniref:basic salivary proline-rich protein 1-like n=1 Tax=Penaeus monodon TaxID=6687 RepID=UPI0018A79FFE|nr:basic salivary proline-rich protein 1-like [Penaeus monodon]